MTNDKFLSFNEFRLKSLDFSVLLLQSWGSDVSRMYQERAVAII
jgi:hypothetical protein